MERTNHTVADPLLETLSTLDSSNKPQPEDPRPLLFLISTPPSASAIRERLGWAAYSYHFVVEALRPLLEEMGTCQIVEQPESRLVFAVRKAEQAGLRPIHLAVTPPQDTYFSNVVPSILFPFWEFPEIPDRALAFDGRQNWSRVCRRADLLLTACGFTAEALRRGGIDRPIHQVPVPIDPGWFDLPGWKPGSSWSYTGRCFVLGVDDPMVGSISPTTDSHQSTSITVVPAGTDRPRPVLTRVKSRLSPATRQRLSAWKRAVLGHGPASLGSLGFKRWVYHSLRMRYHRYVRRWLSDDALEQVGRIKQVIRRRLASGQALVEPPHVVSRTVSVEGIVYTSIFNLRDPRKNAWDLLSSFLLAFRDRDDVTLVLKLVASPVDEHMHVKELEERHKALGIEHRCRVVVITDYLDDSEMLELARVTTIYVNTSRAEGACLPLQQYLAAGRPAVAPCHTSLADFMDNQVGWVVPSHPEPTHWPHDPEHRIETTWHRLVWSELKEQLERTAWVITHDPEQYQNKAEAARRRMDGYASRSVVRVALRAALDRSGRPLKSRPTIITPTARHSGVACRA